MNGGRVVAISGGVGGAKLALGLYHHLPPERLSVIVNVGDDFSHLGLAISPDIDTVLYTLADLANLELGWGRRDESWNFMAALETVGGETWFRLGDRDLALHVERTRRLAAGEKLSTIIADIARRWGIRANILPVTDDEIRTVVDTDAGMLPFQDYFVRTRCEPKVNAIRFDGILGATLTPAVVDLLSSSDIEAIILCPSNPYLSIDPMLAVPGFRNALRCAPAPVVAITPIVGNRAIKGPTAKIMRELGLEVSAETVMRYYADVIDGFVVDSSDSDAAAELSVPTLAANTVMVTLDDRIRLAAQALDFARDLRR